MRTLVTWCLLLLSLLYSTCALSVPSQTIVEQRSLVASSAVSGGASVDDVNGSLLSRVVVGGYFGLWYALNVYYNIVNKKVLNMLDSPATVAAIQLGVGSLYTVCIWLMRLRERPRLTQKGRIAAFQVGFFHSLGQLCTVLSLGAGPVSFTHIVKAMEPFFSALISGLVTGAWMPVSVYLALLPVVGGVGYACMKEDSFSWLAFGMAMSSNVAFAFRAVLSKRTMSSSQIGSGLSSANVFGLVTNIAFLLSIPMAFLSEGQSFITSWRRAIVIHNPATVLRMLVLSGLFHYLNNEVMFLALGKVHPITLAVGNTMKRVVILVASVIVFGNSISLQSGIGSAVGLIGVLLYSLSKQRYESNGKSS